MAVISDDSECAAAIANNISQNHFCTVFSNFKDYLTSNTNGRIKWLGDIENLKHFMAELFDAEGVWSSPGGSAKVFLYDDIKLTWYADNNSIIFKGVKGKILERSVISMLKNGCLLTNALSNDNGKLNALDYGNCDENKDESFLRDCSSQTASQCERSIKIKINHALIVTDY